MGSAARSTRNVLPHQGDNRSLEVPRKASSHAAAGAVTPHRKGGLGRLHIKAEPVNQAVAVTPPRR